MNALRPEPSAQATEILLDAPTEEAVRVLLVEDDPGDARLIGEELKEVVGSSFRVERVDRLTTALARLEVGGVDVVLLDLGLPETQGIDTFRTVRDAYPSVAVVVLTGLHDPDAALTAVQEGAQDFLMKDEATAAVLARAIRYAIERQRMTGHLEGNLREQAALAELTRRALAGEDLEFLLHDACMLVARSLGVDRVELLEPLPDGTYVLRSGIGWGRDLVGKARVEGGPGTYTGFVRAAPGPVVIDDLGAEDRFSPARLHAESGVVAGVAVALPEGGGGVLGAYSTSDRVFGQREANALESVANVLTQTRRRLAAEERAARLQRLYTVLAEANRVMVRAPDRSTLFEVVTRAIADHGGFRLVWVGAFDEGVVRPLASAGPEVSYLEGLRIEVDPDSAIRGPTAEAVIEGHPAVVNYLSSDARMRPWRSAAFKHGFLASAAFPLRSGNRVVAVLNVYSGEPAFFDRDERSLLEDLCGDVSFVLTSMEREERRRSAERALLEAEARYVGLFESAVEGIFQSGTDGTVEAANPALAHMLGYRTPEELIRTAPSVQMLYADPGEPDLEALFADGDLVAGLERQILRRDGSPIWVSVNVRAVRDEVGRIIRLDGSAVDVTDRRQAIDDLTRQDAILRAVAAAATRFLTGDWEFRFEETMEHLGRAAEVDTVFLVENEVGEDGSLLGTYSREWTRSDLNRALGEVAYQRVPYRSAGLERWERLLSSGEILRGHAKDMPASERPFLALHGVRSLLLVPVLVEGEWWGVLGYAQVDRERVWSSAEIEGLRVAAEALGAAVRLQRSVDAMRQLAEIVEASDDAIIRIDLDGIVTSWNSGATQMYGYNPNEVLGRVVTFLVPEELEETFWENIRSAASGGQIRDHETVRLRKDGTPIDVSLAISPIRSADGAVVGLAGISRDVREQKRAERELRRSYEALRRTDEARSRLLSRLIDAQEQERRRLASDLHDDPVQKLTAVSMRLQLAGSKVRDPETSGTIERIRGLVDETVARLRGLMFELHPPVLDRDGIVAALRIHIERLEEETGIEATLVGSLVEEPPVETRIILYRIAQELLQNVRKHADASRVDVLVRPQQAGVEVEVSDDGVGFDPRVVDEVRPGHLGLADLRERVELAGGRLTIESAPGSGTRVVCWIPVDGGAEVDPPTT